MSFIDPSHLLLFGSFDLPQVLIGTRNWLILDRLRSTDVYTLSLFLVLKPDCLVHIRDIVYR